MSSGIDPIAETARELRGNGPVTLKIAGLAEAISSAWSAVIAARR